jgi:hypothetical protein
VTEKLDDTGCHHQAVIIREFEPFPPKGIFPVVITNARPFSVFSFCLKAPRGNIRFVDKDSRGLFARPPRRDDFFGHVEGHSEIKLANNLVLENGLPIGIRPQDEVNDFNTISMRLDFPARFRVCRSDDLSVRSATSTFSPGRNVNRLNEGNELKTSCIMVSSGSEFRHPS